MQVDDVVRMRREGAVIPLMLNPEYDPTEWGSGPPEEGEPSPLVLDEEKDDPNWLTGTVIWREGYSLRIELEDGSIVAGDEMYLTMLRGLRPL